MLKTTTKTTCAYCGVGCGVDVDTSATAFASDVKKAAVKGDVKHPANLGRLCSKGLNLGETLDNRGRLLHPQVNGEQTDWNTAVDFVADGFNKIIKEHGPNSVAFYVSGQLLTEDYYVANKLMKGFIGSANIDTNSRLCMSSAVAGYKRAFGADAVPCNYEDLEQTDLLIISGSNAAWCHPVLFRRIEAAKAARPQMKIVVIDPRKTASCDLADLHLPVKSGTDTTLFNGLLKHLVDNNAIDQDYIDSYTEGFEAALDAASDFDLSTTSDITGISSEDLSTFFSWFSRTEKTITFYSMGLNQSTSGTDNANSIINAHLATGRIGKTGAGPFSITGQPNAMGGREVGGLANQLAAHMDIPNPTHRSLLSEFWNTDNICTEMGALAVDMFDKIHSGEIKAVWIMATNPVVSLPNADKVKEALEKCELVVVSDCMAETDTAVLANVHLPATGWGEKDGTVTNSERRMSRQRPFLPAAGEAKHDWWIMTQVARAMGFAEAFPYDTPCDVFKEHAQLSAYRNSTNDVLRDFNINKFVDITEAEYETFEPVQWPVTKENPEGTERLFTDNLFFTPNRKAKFLPIIPKGRANLSCDTYPFILNTGRIRDQWHTMTRTGKASKLHTHISEQNVAVHPEDADSLGLKDQEIAELSSAWGTMLARTSITEDVRKGEVFVPIHWNEQYAKASRVDALVNPAVDSFSGQPEFKHTPVALKAATMSWHGFLVTSEYLHVDALNSHDFDYIAKVTLEEGCRYELAAQSPAAFKDWILALFGDGYELLSFEDKQRGNYRYGLINQEGKLVAVLMVSKHYSALPNRQWLVDLINTAEPLETLDRRALLSGKPAEGLTDCGETVCSCFGVGENTIVNAITEQGLDSVEAIGSCLKAGTNCGSCKPELRQLLAQNMPTEETVVEVIAV